MVARVGAVTTSNRSTYTQDAQATAEPQAVCQNRTGKTQTPADCSCT